MDEFAIRPGTRCILEVMAKIEGARLIFMFIFTKFPPTNATYKIATYTIDIPIILSVIFEILIGHCFAIRNPVNQSRGKLNNECNSEMVFCSISARYPKTR
uniref:Uncharacterized protein n=1 Tax=Photinus pyralis TaxID=7054 RepID=A0A1Y1MNC0_PHOPY